MKYLFFIIFSFSSWAQNNQGVQVHIVNPHINSTRLENNYRVTTESQVPNNLPSREEREMVLYGLKQVKNWDELKKDIFFHDLQNKTLTKLMLRYPEFSEEELKTLQDKVK